MSSIEELQGEIQALREELRELRERPYPIRAAEAVQRSLSRRNLLRAAPLAAVGGAVAAFGTAPASAAVGQPVLLGKTNDSAGQTTEITGSVAVMADDSAAVAASFTGSHELSPEGPIGQDAVQVAVTGPGTGLTLEVTDGFLNLFPNDAIPQVGTGVRVQVERGSAFVGSTSSAASSTDAVTIDYAGTSRALYAQSHNPANINGTVTGVNEGHGIGVWGEQRNNTGSGFGVVGVGGKLGRGSQFTGGVAQTRLVPGTASTHPTTGKTGDLYVDAAVRLWFCTKASAGETPATWKQIG